MNASGTTLTGTLKIELVEQRRQSEPDERGDDQQHVRRRLRGRHRHHDRQSHERRHVPNLVVKRGAILRFHNSDTIDHIIHGDGTMFPHENQTVGAAACPVATTTSRRSGSRRARQGTLGCHDARHRDVFGVPRRVVARPQLVAGSAMWRLPSSFRRIALSRCRAGAARRRTPRSTTTAAASATSSGAYFCSIEDGGYKYPGYPCAIRKIDGRWMLAKLAGSQRFRGEVKPRGEGFTFDGEFYCPWGDCTQPLHGVFKAARANGALRGTFRDAQPERHARSPRRIARSVARRMAAMAMAALAMAARHTAAIATRQPAAVRLDSAVMLHILCRVAA